MVVLITVTAAQVRSEHAAAAATDMALDVLTLLRMDEDTVPDVVPNFGVLQHASGRVVVDLAAAPRG